MSAAGAWVPILLAGAATQLLRLVPVLLVRLGSVGLPRGVERVLESAGFATIGGLIALVVLPAGGSDHGLLSRETASRVAALLLAFVLFLRWRRGLLCLAAAYAAYVLLARVSGGA
jgi:branched-subunit amino acid transport protein